MTGAPRVDPYLAGALGAALCLGLPRPMKGLMVAARIRNKAAQHRRDEGA